MGEREAPEPRVQPSECSAVPTAAIDWNRLAEVALPPRGRQYCRKATDRAFEASAIPPSRQARSSCQVWASPATSPFRRSPLRSHHLRPRRRQPRCGPLAVPSDQPATPTGEGGCCVCPDRRPDGRRDAADPALTKPLRSGAGRRTPVAGSVSPPPRWRGARQLSHGSFYDPFNGARGLPDR